MAGNKNSGRKSSSHVTAGVQATVDAAAYHGAGYILKVASGEVKNPSWPRLDAAKFCIEQKLGKAKTRLSLPTDGQGRTIIPYSAIVILAERADKEEGPALPPAPVVEVIEGEAVEK